MGRENGVASVDAAEVGLALAIPARLRSHIEAMLAMSGPVEQAVVAGWAGMDSLRLMTADLNGSGASPRMIGVSRARTVLDYEAVEQTSSGGAGPSVSEGDVHDRAQNSAARAASALDVYRAAIALGGVGSRHVDGGWAVDGGIAPVPSGDGDSGEPAGPSVWSTRVSHDDVAVAPSIGENEHDAEPADDRGGPERFIAPVMVRVVRGSASKGGSGRAGMLDVSFGDAGGVNAVAPCTGDWVTSGVGMRADVVAALRARAEMQAVAYDDQASSRLPDGQDPHRAAVAGKIGDFPAANDVGSTPLGWGGSRGAMAPESPERGAGGSGEALSGHIMLDGHPLGAWLGNRMARDAARPGAGMTSFDPRQAPAWTPSGAL